MSIAFEFSLFCLLALAFAGFALLGEIAARRHTEAGELPRFWVRLGGFFSRQQDPSYHELFEHYARLVNLLRRGRYATYFFTGLAATSLSLVASQLVGWALAGALATAIMLGLRSLVNGFHAFWVRRELAQSVTLAISVTATVVGVIPTVALLGTALLLALGTHENDRRNIAVVYQG